MPRNYRYRDGAKHLSEEELKYIKEEIPLQRIGNDKDVERCVEWLIDDEYVTDKLYLLMEDG